MFDKNVGKSRDAENQYLSGSHFSFSLKVGNRFSTAHPESGDHTSV